MSYKKIDLDELGQCKIKLEIDAVTAVILIGQLQLATRHPKNNGPSVPYAVAFARKLQQIIAEKFPDTSLPVTMEMGWNPNFDIE